MEVWTARMIAEGREDLVLRKHRSSVNKRQKKKLTQRNHQEEDSETSDSDDSDSEHEEWKDS